MEEMKWYQVLGERFGFYRWSQEKYRMVWGLPKKKKQ
jgi:hypothetical protein